MKTILLLSTLIILTSCGAIQDECGSDIKMGCNAFLGEVSDSSTDVQILQDKNVDLKEQLAELLNATDNELLALETEIENLNEIILEFDTEIVEIINPCGYYGDNDEVVLKVGDKFLAVYRNSKYVRYLVELADGNYRTEDADRCRFSISNGEYSEI